MINLLGRLKVDTGIYQHLKAVANKKFSSLKVRLWVVLLKKSELKKGQNDGTA